MVRLGVALAFLLAVPAAALADAPPRFAFTSTSPVNVAAGGTTAVRVCNGTGAPLDVSFTLESLRGFDLDPATVTGIAPGECGETAVVAPAAITGSPAGTIVATSRVGVIRRAVVPTDVGAARSAATDLTLAAEHYLGSQHAHLVGAASLSLGPYPEATKAADVEAPSGVLAVLQNGSHRAYLTVPENAGVTFDHTYAKVPLDIDGASATGSYKGQVAIGGTPISITVAVGDPWWLCALAILFGLAFAAFTTVATQRWWGGRQARLAADAIPRTLEAAVLAHNRRTKCLPRLNVDDSTAYVAKVKEAYAHAMRRVLLPDPTSDAYKAFLKLVDDARDDAAFVADENGLTRAFISLHQEIDRLKRRALDARPQHLLDAAASILANPLAPGEAVGRAAEAKKYTTLFDVWPDLWRLASEYWDWYEALRLRYDSPLLLSAGATLAELRDDLRASREADSIDTADAERRLRVVHRHLWEVGMGPVPDSVRESLQLLGVAPTSLAGEGRPTVSVRSAVSWVPGIPAIPWHAIETAAARVGDTALAAAGRAATPVAYALVVLLAVAGALSTGLTTVYSSTFGSITDYIAAIGLGSAAGLAAKAVLDGVGGLRGLGA